LSQQSNREEAARRYLLGTLSDEERDQLEQRYFSDNAEFHEIEIAEDDLIDGYVSDKLARNEREQFERVLAHQPRLKERVAVSRLLIDEVSRQSASARATVGKQPSRNAKGFFSFFTFRNRELAAAFAVLVVLIGGLGFFAGWLRLREESRRIGAERAVLETRQREIDKQAAEVKSERERLAANNDNRQPSDQGHNQQQPQTGPTNNASRSAIALVLSPGASRGTASSNRACSARSDCDLTLELENVEYRAYKAVVLNPDRVPVFSAPLLRPRRSPQGAVLKFKIPAKKLTPNDYIIAINGQTATGGTQPLLDYFFRVDK
jgi:hypothetical protein